ncbi:unnamed protein product [Larinioides sclopetarius]|uniref:Uncharacterized protein n=1 Tax=Larinioides sclopetarius TaxID=280406 RepID=A0AAV2B0Y1_9ARAC
MDHVVPRKVKEAVWSLQCSCKRKHTARCLKNVNHANFPDERVISCIFLTVWSARTPDLSPYDFSLLGFLEDPVYLGHVTTDGDMKANIVRPICPISKDMLFAIVDHVVKEWILFVSVNSDLLMTTLAFPMHAKPATIQTLIRRTMLSNRWLKELIPSLLGSHTRTCRA